MTPRLGTSPQKPASAPPILRTSTNPARTAAAAAGSPGPRDGRGAEPGACGAKAAMIACQEVITELWDFLDGELPVERAALVADPLAECARCYPQYRFEYAFLAAVARQRAPAPLPSGALARTVAAAIPPRPPAAPLRVRPPPD